MLRLTEIKLPLDHPEADLRAAILKRLKVTEGDLLGFTVFRRGYDARKKSDIHFVYTVDAEVKDERAALQRLHDDRHVAVTPDMNYRFVAEAPAELAERPVVIGLGPC